MTRRTSALALLVVAVLATPAAAALPASCAAPSGFTHLGGRLIHAGMRIAGHDRLTIVAIGSSSTAGTGATSDADTYPSRLADELRQRLPRDEVMVANKGVGGETASDMTARFDRDVLALHPDLVIWQLGTNSVLRDADVAAFHDIVRAGIERLRGAGIDVVMMDMQYAPAVLEQPRWRDFERALGQLAKEEGVPLFRRFALMHHWVDSHQLDFKSMLSSDGLHQNDLSYRCVGTLLADAIVDTALPSAMTSRR
jgi:acyl-CoA thioesterase-1